MLQSFNTRSRESGDESYSTTITKYAIYESPDKF